MKLVLVIPTQEFGRWRENTASWGTDTTIFQIHGIRPLTAAYQRGFEEARELDPDVIGFVHDDVTCYDPNWKERVLAEFADPEVGLVGFGGSTGHGAADIYQVPYEWHQVAREGRFMSNLRNAEQHGERITGSAEAKCLDGFAMFVRTKILDFALWKVKDYSPGIVAYLDRNHLGGWPVGTPIKYFGYDYWLSCEARRQKMRIRVVEVECEHTCPLEYRGYVLEDDASLSHQWLYNNYQDTFPARS